MKKQNILILILSLFLFAKNTNAANYDMILETKSLEVTENSNVTIYITLNNISGISNGLNVCEATITNDSNITINSITGINGWTVTQGEKLIFDTTAGALIKTQIAQIEATVTGESKVNLTNITCTDGTNEYTASDETIFFEVPSQTITTTEANPITQKSEYTTSTTVESEKTGVLEISFILILITILITLVTIKLNKKNIFKKSI